MSKNRRDDSAVSNTPEDTMTLIGPGEHMILFYENSNHARKLEFEFLEAGLRLGESALYASSEDEPAQVLESVRALGIDVGRYFKSGKLRVHKVPDPAMDPEGPLHGFKEFLRLERGSVTGPLRQVTRIFHPMTEEEVNSIIEIERLVEVSVEGTQDRIVCSFSVKGEQHPSFGAWFIEMIRNHHGAVFVPATSEGVGFVK